MNTTDRKNAFGQDNKQSGASHSSESAAPQKSKRNDAADVVESDFDSIDPADSKPLKVEIDCVTPPTEEQLRRIREIISRDYNAGEIELTIKRVPSVVGGFNIFVGDDNYDWTTLGRIRQLRKSFQSLKKEYDTSKIISLLREDISGFRLDHGHQQVGFAAAGHDGGQGVVVADGRDLVGGNGVVFVDDRQRAQLQQAKNGVPHITAALLVLYILAGEQHLCHCVVVLVEQLVIGVHQLALADCGGGLLGRRVLRPLAQVELAKAHCNGTGGDEDDLVSHVLEVAQNLAEALHALNIQPPGGVRQRRGADLDNDSHDKNPPIITAAGKTAA